MVRIDQGAAKQVYTKALFDYGKGDGPNPGTSGEFSRKHVAEEAKS